MKERNAVERLMKRIYEDRLRRTGRLPDRDDVREMEKKAERTAEKFDRKNRK